MFFKILKIKIGKVFGVVQCSDCISKLYIFIRQAYSLKEKKDQGINNSDFYKFVAQSSNKSVEKQKWFKFKIVTFLLILVRKF